MKCKIQNTECPFQTIDGCYYILHGKTCAISSGIDIVLYASQVLEMTTTELSEVGGWCCDMRDLLVGLQYCPITMHEINEIDSMTIDRMQTGYFIRQNGQIIKEPHIAGFCLIQDTKFKN